MSLALIHNIRVFQTSVSLSPIQKVPCELWSMIFSLCLASNRSIHRKPPEEVLRDLRLSPVVLSSVCKTWRHIACNLEALWSTCWLNFRHPELNTIWLKRAGTSFLHLYGSYERNLNATAFMRSILPFQERWKSLEVGFGFLPRVTIDFTPRFKCPALESFKVKAGDNIPVWMSKILPKAPKLHELATFNPWFRYSVNLTRTRFPLLTSLVICESYPKEVITALVMLPQLKELFANVRFDEDELPDDTDITHTSLSQLTIHDEGTPYVLDGLTCHSLSAFQVSQTSDIDSFLDFFDRSSCHLTDLDLSCDGFTAEMILDILNCDSIHAHVEKMRLDEISTGSILEVLDFLRLGRGKPRLPRLNHLTLNSCSLINVPEGLMADVIFSRYRGRSSYERDDCSAGSQTKGFC